jgi:hypothetical protein
VIYINARRICLKRAFATSLKIPGTPEKTIQAAIEKAVPKAELPNLYKATAP